jgi:hypothetical protein
LNKYSILFGFEDMTMVQRRGDILTMGDIEGVNKSNVFDFQQRHGRRRISFSLIGLSRREALEGHPEKPL